MRTGTSSVLPARLSYDVPVREMTRVNGPDVFANKKSKCTDYRKRSSRHEWRLSLFGVQRKPLSPRGSFPPAPKGVRVLAGRVHAVHTRAEMPGHLSFNDRNLSGQAGTRYGGLGRQSGS